MAFFHHSLIYFPANFSFILLLGIINKEPVFNLFILHENRCSCVCFFSMQKIVIVLTMWMFDDKINIGNC